MTYDTIGDAETRAGGESALLAGRFRIVRQLGQGGMGSVWLAEDTQLDGKQFAIKMLPSILVSNKRAYRQLKDEALVAMKLVHQNIVTLRAFEENNGNPFLVMDYIDGQTLDDYLAEMGQLDEEETIRLLKPIAAALDYAHGEGVVHRDVKPANVMIRKDGHPFILDFGIAREIQETMTRVTGKLSSGTLLYMSPEQLNGDAPKPAQDVYSFAAMAYECLKGEPPFVRGAIEDQIKNKIPGPLPGGLLSCAAIMAGLAKKPEERPLTCAAVLVGEVTRAETRRRGEEGGVCRTRRDESGKAHYPQRVVESKPRMGNFVLRVGGRLRSRIYLVAIIALLAALAGIGYLDWKKYDATRQANEARIARVKKILQAEAPRPDNPEGKPDKPEKPSATKPASPEWGGARILLSPLSPISQALTNRLLGLISRQTIMWPSHLMSYRRATTLQMSQPVLTYPPPSFVSSIILAIATSSSQGK